MDRDSAFPMDDFICTTTLNSVCKAIVSHLPNVNSTSPPYQLYSVSDPYSCLFPFAWPGYTGLFPSHMSTYPAVERFLVGRGP